ncbi:MAG: phage terminase large subunit family protein [Chromatiaceae bacterium]|nr:phage terminase large subunit family protein [Candidatus Thioaporhodococcus sediminis]
MTPIARAFSDVRYRMVVGVMGSQMGKTETIFNILGHRFDDGPYTPALYIGPTEKQARSVSADRVQKMLKTTPSLWEKLEKGSRNKVAEKWISGVRLGFGWAGSATELASHPSGLVFVDERDRMESDVGGEGDPVIMAQARTKNYLHGVVGVFSTPTLEGASPIWTLFEEGTRGKWSWSCVHCQQWFIPTLSLLQWPRGANPSEAEAQAIVVCPTCGGIHTTPHRELLNLRGRYQFHQLDDNGEEVCVGFDPPANSTASYWVSGLASPWQSFGQIAGVMVRAYASHEPERIQATINTYLGELYRSVGVAPDWREVEACKLPYLRRTIPRGVQLLTMGVDVQKRGIYYVTRGWGFNIESWLIDYGFIPGETEYDSVWILLSQILQYTFGEYSIRRVFADSGYRPGDRHQRPEHAVYAWCRRHPGLAYPTKGHESQDAPVKASLIETTPSGRLRQTIQLWHLDTDYAKAWIHGRVRWPPGEAGGWHLPSDTGEDYCRQIVSEQLLTKPSGRRVWLVKNRDNHYLDCEVNALAAALTLQVQSLPELPPEVEVPNNSVTSSRPVSQGQFERNRRGLFG